MDAEADAEAEGRHASFPPNRVADDGILVAVVMDPPRDGVRPTEGRIVESCDVIASPAVLPPALLSTGPRSRIEALESMSGSRSTDIEEEEEEDEEESATDATASDPHQRRSTSVHASASSSATSKPSSARPSASIWFARTHRASARSQRAPSDHAGCWARDASVVAGTNVPSTVSEKVEVSAATAAEDFEEEGKEEEEDGGAKETPAASISVPTPAIQSVILRSSFRRATRRR